MKNILLTLILLLLMIPQFGTAQDSLTNELRFEVIKMDPYVSIAEEKLDEARTIIDLNPRYPSSWVKDYISVEIQATCKGKIRNAVSRNDTLNREQKDIIRLADHGKEILVNIQYIPENKLKNNTAREFDFTFTVDPEIEAKYPGGQQQLQKYLKENAIDKIPNASFESSDFTAITFSISEEGEVINAHIFESVFQTAEREKADEVFLEAIRKMPCWKPAEYSNGTKVKQEFAFIVGNMESCLIYLVKTPPPEIEN